MNLGSATFKVCDLRQIIERSFEFYKVEIDNNYVPPSLYWERSKWSNTKWLKNLVLILPELGFFPFILQSWASLRGHSHQCCSLHTHPLPCGPHEGKDQVSLTRQDCPGRTCSRRWLSQDLLSTSFTSHCSCSKRQAVLHSVDHCRVRLGHS